MSGPALVLILVGASAGAQAPLAAFTPLSLGRTTAGRPAYLAAPPARHSSGALAWAVTPDANGQPSLQAYAFLLTRVAFSLSNSPDRWPAICDEFWNWNPVARRFQPATAASGIMSGTPRCTFRGTIYFKGHLEPRFPVRPEVTVVVEGAQGPVPIPVRVVIEQRRSADLAGTPVFLGEISTTALADGPQRLRVEGGYREYRIDGDPATPELEEGGDTNMSFLVANHPPRLIEVAIAAGGATLYRGTWSAERRITTDVLALTIEGGSFARAAKLADAAVRFRFSLPVAQVTVELRSRDGSWFALDPPQPDEEGDAALGWRASLPLGQLTPGAWTIRVSARDSDGNPLERLHGTELPVAALGNLDPDSGNCVAGGHPCDLGVDTVHRLAVTAR